MRCPRCFFIWFIRHFGCYLHKYSRSRSFFELDIPFLCFLLITWWYKICYDRSYAWTRPLEIEHNNSLHSLIYSCTTIWILIWVHLRIWSSRSMVWDVDRIDIYSLPNGIHIVYLEELGPSGKRGAPKDVKREGTNR